MKVTVKVIAPEGAGRAETVKITNEAGQELTTVRSVRMYLHPSHCTFNLELCDGFMVDYEGKARFQMRHPLTDKFAFVHRIEFTDGSTFETGDTNAADE